VVFGKSDLVIPADINPTLPLPIINPSFFLPLSKGRGRVGLLFTREEKGGVIDGNPVKKY